MTPTDVQPNMKAQQQASATIKASGRNALSEVLMGTGDTEESEDSRFPRRGLPRDQIVILICLIGNLVFFRLGGGLARAEYRLRPLRRLRDHNLIIGERNFLQRLR